MDSGEGGRVSPKRSGMVVTGHHPPTGKDRLKDKGNSTQRGQRGRNGPSSSKAKGEDKKRRGNPRESKKEQKGTALRRQLLEGNEGVGGGGGRAALKKQANHYIDPKAATCIYICVYIYIRILS